MKPTLKRIAKKGRILPSLGAAMGLGGPRIKALACLPKNSIGVEIGVHLGDFSHLILAIVNPRKLYLVDPWKAMQEDGYDDSWYGSTTSQDTMDERHRSVCERFRNDIEDGKVVVKRSDSVTALSSFDNASLDFVYIDGDHTYEAVKRDIELSLEKLKPGGLLTGDDYGPGNWWNGGVKRAVDEVGWNESVVLKWIQDTQFVLQKK